MQISHGVPAFDRRGRVVLVGAVRRSYGGACWHAAGATPRNHEYRHRNARSRGLQQGNMWFMALQELLTGNLHKSEALRLWNASWPCASRL